MRFNFGYTGIRVRDLDKAIDFFTKLLGMKVQARIPAPWHKGEFVNLVSRDKKHWLEINWYADDSPVAGPFSTGDQLDHLGFEVDDFEGALKRLNAAGYPTIIGPRKAGEWEFAFVKGVDDIWLYVYKITRKPRKRTARKRKK
jgi:lactoylglutathione lyase